MSSSLAISSTFSKMVMGTANLWRKAIKPAAVLPEEPDSAGKTFFREPPFSGDIPLQL